jgi:predicted dehydrogenase
MHSKLKTNRNRRAFIQQGLQASLFFGVAPYIKAAPPARYRTALIGCGWWGMNVLHEAMAAKRAKVVGLCDVYERPMLASKDEVSQRTGEQPRCYKDYRDLLQRERPEVVIVATPDHWHALPCIEALKTGAHVYVEKPTSHTIGESRAMLHASRASDRAVQVGLHRRIGPHHLSGMQFLKSGKVGTIGMVRLFVTGGGGGPETPVGHTKPPTGMDWDMWCGPAPSRPYCRKLTPGGWRNFLDYANGTLGDWGVHWLDQLLWWSEETSPKTVYSTGGRPVLGPAIFNDKEGSTSDAPDTQTVSYAFENFTAVWEHRKYAGNAQEHHRIGAYFYGSKGVFHMGWRDGWTFYPKSKGEPVVHEDPSFDNEKDGHNVTPLWKDFLRAADEGGSPVAGMEVAHRSSVLPMLGMISHKLGRSIQWDGNRETILNDPEAERMIQRDYRTPWVYPSI